MINFLKNRMRLIRELTQYQNALKESDGKLDAIKKLQPLDLEKTYYVVISEKADGEKLMRFFNDLKLAGYNLPKIMIAGKEFKELQDRIELTREDIKWINKSFRENRKLESVILPINYDEIKHS